MEGAGGTGVEGTGGFRGTEPGRGAGGRWWSPAAVSTNNRSTHPKQISHAIPPRHGSMHAQKPQNINDQTSTLEIHSGELHAKLPKSSQDSAPCHKRAPQVWRTPEGRAAVPVVGGGARPRRQWITGPGRSIHKQQQHPAQTNFACNSPTTRIHARSKTAEYQRSDFNT